MINPELLELISKLKQLIFKVRLNHKNPPIFFDFGNEMLGSLTISSFDFGVSYSLSKTTGRNQGSLFNEIKEVFRFQDASVGKDLILEIHYKNFVRANEDVLCVRAFCESVFSPLYREKESEILKATLIEFNSCYNNILNSIPDNDKIKFLLKL
jgi:hypothetical protein